MCTKISIHALREEGDYFCIDGCISCHRFQSTPSARRATGTYLLVGLHRHNFNPRPPRGGRLLEQTDIGSWIMISIHALREEGDQKPACVCCGEPISIHALREEGDRIANILGKPELYFNPRPPRGGRRKAVSGAIDQQVFQSTPSARRATPTTANGNPDTIISIHALREEGDTCLPPFSSAYCYFNPRPPRGGRHLVLLFSLAYCYFNPRPPRGGRQQKRRKIRHVCSIIHTCAQFEKELYEGSGEMQNKSC